MGKTCLSGTFSMSDRAVGFLISKVGLDLFLAGAGLGRDDMGAVDYSEVVSSESLIILTSFLWVASAF